MSLSAYSFAIIRLLQNIVLISISLTFIPLVTFLTVTSHIISPYHRTTKTIIHIRQRPDNFYLPGEPSAHCRRTVLVTGMGMSKGLTIARSFYRAGHRVIGADFEPHSIPVCGRFSTSISKFYRLRKPCTTSGTQEYIDDLLSIAKKESVELWVSCSGVASAIEDGEAQEALKKIGVSAMQFDADITSLLHEKDKFIENAKRLGLNVPETYRINSTLDALCVLHPLKVSSGPKKTYILKPVGVDDSIRGDMTLFPLKTKLTTCKYIGQLGISPSRPFVLQEFIKGQEYCTHSIAIRGRIEAFTACESSELLMHYRALPPTSSLFKAMLRYTELYAKRMGENFTGHFSIDFLLQDESTDSESASGTDSEVEDLMGKLFPIECNPRAHTAAVLFADHSLELADTYLSLVQNYEKIQKISEPVAAKPIAANPVAAEPVIAESVATESVATKSVAAESVTAESATTEPTKATAAEPTTAEGKAGAKPCSANIIIPQSSTPGYYWIGHDIITRVLLPVLHLLTFRVGRSDVTEKWTEFLNHLMYWRDGTWEVWDPWPFWWLYAVYWPGMFLMSIRHRSWWSRCNVSTTKMFRC